MLKYQKLTDLNIQCETSVFQNPVKTGAYIKKQNKTKTQFDTYSGLVYIHGSLRKGTEKKKRKLKNATQRRGEAFETLTAIGSCP